MMTDKQEVPILLSLIPKLIRGGHIIPYHIAVNKAAHYINWKHIAVVPYHENVIDLPGEWYTALSAIDMEEKLHPIVRLLRTSDIWQLAVTIVNFLKYKILPDTNHPIIFIENFIHTQLLALYIALCIMPKKNTKKINVWLLYRQETHIANTRWLYKLINNLIKKKISPGKFHLLTDSEVLSKSLENYFHEKFTVMPIPHTDSIIFTHFPQQSDEIICWWPGDPRPEKGWQIIKYLIDSNYESAQQICLVASKASKLSSKTQGIKLKLLDNFLPKHEYLKMLQTSHVILLPYDPIAYGERTSGIFVECIFAGKIPVVTQGTWMAKELLKYGLEELIFDWHQSQTVINEIVRISTSLTIKEKLKQMQASYQTFHSIEYYAEKIKTIFDTSVNL